MACFLKIICFIHFSIKFLFETENVWGLPHLHKLGYNDMLQVNELAPFHRELTICQWLSYIKLYISQ